MILQQCASVGTVKSVYLLLAVPLVTVLFVRDVRFASCMMKTPHLWFCGRDGSSTEFAVALARLM